MKLNGLRSFSKFFVVSLLLIGLSGCGGGDDGVSGGSNDYATHCIHQAVTGNRVAITNTCSRTVIFVTTTDRRLVIPAGETHYLSESYSGFGACFSPSVPNINASAGTFLCE